MIRPSISIIIPVFKVKDFILECLESVTNQDYQGEMECILIDDRGDDGSIELCEQFIAQQQSNVKFSIIHNEKNLKQSASRNAGMRIAKGEYIYFLDSDDWLATSAISTIVKPLNDHPDCEIVQAGIKTTDPNVFRWLDCARWKNTQLDYTNDRNWIINTCSERLGMIPMTPVSKLMKREFLLKNNFSFVEGIFHEDEIWLALLAKHLTSVAFVHDNSYYYRIRTNSTTNGGQLKHYDDWKRVWLEIFKLFDDTFCPARMLSQIETDTSKFFHDTSDKKVKRMLIGIKARLMQYCELKKKIRIALWIIKYGYKAI